MDIDKALDDFRGDIYSARNNNYGYAIENAVDFALKHHSAKLKAQINQAILEARLSEVEKATNYIHPHELQDRIAELTKLLKDKNE